VTTQAGCSWTVSSPVSWITVTGSGTGSGSANYSAAVNSTAGSRSTTLTVAGKSVSVTQGGLTAPAAPTNLRIVR
jgi:hypothetical protein